MIHGAALDIRRITRICCVEERMRGRARFSNCHVHADRSFNRTAIGHFSHLIIPRRCYCCRCKGAVNDCPAQPSHQQHLRLELLDLSMHKLARRMHHAAQGQIRRQRTSTKRKT